MVAGLQIGIPDHEPEPAANESKQQIKNEAVGKSRQYTEAHRPKYKREKWMTPRATHTMI